MRRSIIFLVALSAHISAAQAPGAAVSGVVYDSIGRAPLAGAIVQLVPADDKPRAGRSVNADSLGRYALADVTDGRYSIGFFHPMLDSLGLDAPVREITVAGGRSVRADLSTPSPARFRAAVCGAQPAPEGGGVVVGVVRDAHDRNPVANASVTGDWLELVFTPQGMVRRIPRLVAKTADNGWFAICNVPSGGTMALIARRGADSTDLIEVQVPADGFLRRELYLGVVRAVASVDTVRAIDTLALVRKPPRLGDGRVSGTVTALAGGRPLMGARVSIANGPQALTNDRGEFTLVDAPTGTRALDVRAVGFYPDHRSVDVVPGAAPLRVSLTTLKAVLDTVRVTASRLINGQNGFEERRRSGFGTFLSREDIMKHTTLAVTDIFKRVTGLQVVSNGFERSIMMRGAFGPCTPDIYVNGGYMPMDADDLDIAINPADITGMEIYKGASIPPNFQHGLSGCGSIVIWTR